MRPQADCSWVRTFVLEELRFAERPLKRDELAELVQGHAPAAGAGWWKRTTAARRVREAIAALIEEGHAIVSTGAGFSLVDTREAREEAARKLDLQAEALHRRAQALRSGPQRMLPLVAAGGGR